jgi:hypothetical protein
VTEWGRVRVQKQAVEGDDPHGGHGRVCEGDRARVGVKLKPWDGRGQTIVF